MALPIHIFHRHPTTHHHRYGQTFCVIKDQNGVITDQNAEIEELRLALRREKDDNDQLVQKLRDELQDAIDSKDYYKNKYRQTK